MHVDDESLPYNIVKDVMQSGYVYKGKVLRPASVVVAN
jgi:molecular chaperone GrpE (heat shock protein)